MKDKKRPDRLWVSVIGSLMFIFFPSSSWRPESFKVKMSWSDVLMVCPCKSKIFLSPFFHLGFHWGSHVNKTGAQSSNLCGAISSSSWNGLHCWVVEIIFSFVETLVTTIAGTWYEYLFHTIFSVPPPERRSFCVPSSAHSQLVNISENMLCKAIPVSLWNFVTCLPVILV